MDNPTVEPRGEACAVAESRWPSAGAVIAAMVLTVLLPDQLRIAPTWVLLVRLRHIGRVGRSWLATAAG
jgi:hypothetical protein